MSLLMQRPPSSGRFERALIPREPAGDPRERQPNANAAGPNVPPISVGPTSSTNAPENFVLSAEAWSGWPAGWSAPPLEPVGTEAWSGTGWGRMVDGWGKVSTAMTCVDLNSRQLASFPVYAMRGSTPYTLPEWRLNPEPELYASWSEFMHATVNSLLLRGECFQWATGRYADGWPARFVTLDPDRVGVEEIDGRIEYLLNGDPLDPADVVHVKYQSWPGVLRGISPLQWVGRSLLTASALETYAERLAARGGVPWAVLKSQGNINAAQAIEAQSLWRLGAQSRDGAPAVLGGLFDLQPLTISPRDMALLELREFDERRICAAFGVPGYLVNVAMADGLTYANASQLFMHHWQATLRPLAQAIAEAWSQWLLPRGNRLEFNPDRYVQPPLDERAQAYQTLFNLVDPASGQRAMTIPEIRAAERMTPDPSVADLTDAERLTGAHL